MPRVKLYRPANTNVLVWVTADGVAYEYDLLDGNIPFCFYEQLGTDLQVMNRKAESRTVFFKTTNYNAAVDADSVEDDLGVVYPTRQDLIDFVRTLTVLFSSGGGGTVASVFGRIGIVTATAGDYTAAQITNVPLAPLTATNVQDALNELAVLASAPFSVQGTWDANANLTSPGGIPLVSSVGTDGHLYIVDTAGTTLLDGNNSWLVGDLVFFAGGVWNRVENSVPYASQAEQEAGTVNNKATTPATSNINNYTTAAAVDMATDYVLIYDASVPGMRKTLLNTITSSPVGIVQNVTAVNTTTNIDLSLGDIVVIDMASLTANTSLNTSNRVTGQTYTFYFTGNSGGYDVTFPSTVWSDGLAFDGFDTTATSYQAVAWWNGSNFIVQL